MPVFRVLPAILAVSFLGARAAAAVTLTSISVVPSSATLQAGTSVSLTAVGTFSDASTRTLQGQWFSKASMNEQRDGQTGAFSNGKFYVFGGASSPGLPTGSTSAEQYDPSTDSWTYRATIPVRRGYSAAAENAGKIYVVGGCVNADCNSPTTALWMYDTTADSWTAKASVPNALFEPAFETIGGNLYLAGGTLFGYVSTNTVRMYDPVGNAWTTKAAMPFARGYAASGVINGKLYVAGGRIDSGGATGAELQIYDPVGNSWTLGAPMPSSRMVTGGAVVDGRLYVIGGDHDQALTNSTDAARVQIYDPRLNSWTEGPAVSTSRYSPTAGAYQGKIYVAGAAFGNAATASLEVLDPNEVLWSSSLPAVATVAAAGLTTALSTGTAVVTASSGPVSGVSTITVIGTPVAPSAFAGTALSSASILWSWADNSSDETGFRVMSGAANLSGDLPSGSTSWTQTGLSANVSTGPLSVQAFNGAGTSNSGTASRFTAAAVPGTPASSNVSMFLATASWTSGGNPGSTVFELERSTGSGFGLRQTSSSAFSFADSMLTPGASYFYRVRAINGDGAASAYAPALTVVTSPWPVLVSLAVTPPAATIPVSSSVLFTAVGTFNDGSTRTLNGAWAPRAPMLEQRDGMAGAMSGGKLYVSGGASSPGLPIGSTSSEAYDPAGDTWTWRASAPVRRGYAFAAENAGKVYVAGGCVNADCNSPTTALYEYDTVADAWTAKASLPAATFEAAFENISGKLYAAGGLLAGYVSTSATRMYDPGGNTWTTKASMPLPRGYAASGVINGKLYVAGGRIDGGAATSADLQIYDPVADSWSIGASMPSARMVTGGAVVNGRLYVLGGDHDQFATVSTDAARALIYDPGSDSWAEGPALIVPRYSPAVGVHQNKIYVAGGGFGNGATAAAETLDPDEASWSSNLPAVGTVTAGGSARGLTPGAANITASTGALNVSGALTVVGLPAAPTGFAGAAQSTSSVLWTWTDAATTEAGYRVMNGASNASGDLAANTTSWLQNGLGASTSATLLVQAFNSSGTANSASASRYSMAAAPGTPSFSGVYQTSGTVAWTSSGNPAAVVYQLERSTGAGFGLQFAGAATTYFDQYMTPGATHYYRVLALNGDSIATAYSATNSVVAVSAPAAPLAAGTPSGTALGTSSITWTWVLASGATTHYLFRASDNSWIANSSAPPYVQTALSPNVAYGLRAAGVNVGGTGPLSPSGTAYTLAVAPASLGSAAVWASSLTVAWGLNGNPAGTTASVERSTNGVAYSTAASGGVLAYSETDLLGCTTYHYRVRNVNGDGFVTSYATAAVVTANTVPAPPSGLSAASNAGGTVTLDWNASPTEGITGYRLFWDGGAGTVSYAGPIATFSSGTFSYVTGVLTSSASYTFALRAVHRCGVVETTGALAMSGAAVAAPAVRAVIKEPDSGKRINGNRVTILGELIYGTPSDVQQISFQYKAAAASTWTVITAANVNHSNPDLDFPYFVHMDATALPAGDYDLRAVAYDRGGTPDSAPPAVRVTMTAVDPDINESVNGSTIKKDQVIANGSASVIDTAGAGENDPAVRVTIPAGAVNAATATVSVTANPVITTAAPRGFDLVGSAIKIDLSNGQSVLNGTAAITLTYPQSVVFPSLLQIYYLNEATGQWSRDFTSTVDTTSRTVTGATPHFSTFALLLGTNFAPNLDDVRVYPVPFKPNGGNPDEGKAWTASDANSGIIFSNLAQGSEIKIYTLTGRLVAALDNAPITGTIRWDVRNNDGRDVASGAYFAVIKAAGSKTLVKKLVIIR